MEVGDIIRDKLSKKLGIVTSTSANLECPTKNNPTSHWECVVKVRWLDEEVRRTRDKMHSFPRSALEVVSAISPGVQRIIVTTPEKE